MGAKPTDYQVEKEAKQGHFRLALPFVGPSLSANSPNLLGEFRPALWWRLVYDASAGIVRTAPVRYGGFDVFSQRFRAGVVLPRPVAHAQAGGAKP